jgi:hypothetical protein
VLKVINLLLNIARQGKLFRDGQYIKETFLFLCLDSLLEYFSRKTKVVKQMKQLLSCRHTLAGNKSNELRENRHKCVCVCPLARLRENHPKSCQSEQIVHQVLLDELHGLLHYFQRLSGM